MGLTILCAFQLQPHNYSIKSITFSVAVDINSFMFLSGLIVSSDCGTWGFQMQANKNCKYGLICLFKILGPQGLISRAFNC